MGSRGLHLDYSALHARYMAGESGTALAKEMGIDFTGLYASWKRRGLPIRSQSDAAKLLHQQRPELNQNIRIATAVRRGSKDTVASMEQRAKTREARGIGISDDERALAERLRELGIPFRQQLAIGRYNGDFAIGATILEIDGGGHNRRINKMRVERHAFLESQGWRVVHVETRRLRWMDVAVEVAHSSMIRMTRP